MLSRKALANIASMLDYWGVRAVCIAGGGEPLLNPHTSEFILALRAAKIQVGVVTNGYLIDRHLDALAQCTWVGVSMDAGAEVSYEWTKATPPGAWWRVRENIARLAKRFGPRRSFGHGVTWKYLVTPGNVGEVAQAARIARDCGCRAIHYRPVGTPWQDIGTDRAVVFSEDALLEWTRQIADAQELDSPDFGVFGVTHKFSPQFERQQTFSACHAVFMTGVVSPPTNAGPKDGYCFGVCCDRRGDPALELVTDCADVGKISAMWGSAAHWAIHDAIKIGADCPRCTYQPHNEIFEQVIQQDAMTHVFI